MNDAISCFIVIKSWVWEVEFSFGTLLSTDSHHGIRPELQKEWGGLEPTETREGKKSHYEASSEGKKKKKSFLKQEEVLYACIASLGCWKILKN